MFTLFIALACLVGFAVSLVGAVVLFIRSEVINAVNVRSV